MKVGSKNFLLIDMDTEAKRILETNFYDSVKYKISFAIYKKYMILIKGAEVYLIDDFAKVDSKLLFTMPDDTKQYYI